MDATVTRAFLMLTFWDHVKITREAYFRSCSGKRWNCRNRDGTVGTVHS